METADVSTHTLLVYAQGQSLPVMILIGQFKLLPIHWRAFRTSLTSMEIVVRSTC